MAVKYHCRKCGKRYIDWGAEKLGFKCPDCDGEELVRVGAGEDRVVKRPSLKRRARKAAPAFSGAEDEDGMVADLDVMEEISDEDELIGTVGGDEADSEAEYDLETAVPADVDDVEETDLELTEDLSFDEVTPAADEAEEPMPEGDVWPD